MTAPTSELGREARMRRHAGSPARPSSPCSWVVTAVYETRPRIAAVMEFVVAQAWSGGAGGVGAVEEDGHRAGVGSDHGSKGLVGHWSLSALTTALPLPSSWLSYQGRGSGPLRPLCWPTFLSWTPHPVSDSQ